MNTFKLALRGLTRNRRRSLVTLAAIAFGFAAIALFAGYTHNVYDGLARSSIYGEMLGHLTLNKVGLRKEGKLDPERYLLTAEETACISAMLQADPAVELVAPRLALNGLVSNGRASTIFIAEGIEPTAMARLQSNPFTAEELHNPNYQRILKQLDSARPEQACLSEGLAELLHLAPEGQAAVLTSTLSGQANALDITVGRLFNTGNAGTNDKFAFITLDLARALLDADGRADRLTVLLKNGQDTETMRARLQRELRAAGFDIEIKTWQELSDFYSQVHGMFDMIFGFIFLIVLTVVLMSIANSMGMTVVERTREIGTLRAMGLKRLGVIRLFTTESLLLTLIGCAGGLLLTITVRAVVNAAGISYMPPTSATPVSLLIDIDIGRIAFAAVLMSLVGVAAAFLPARRAARRLIIDALGHV